MATEKARSGHVRLDSRKGELVASDVDRVARVRRHVEVRVVSGPRHLITTVVHAVDGGHLQPAEEDVRGRLAACVSKAPTAILYRAEQAEEQEEIAGAYARVRQVRLTRSPLPE